MKWHDTSHAHLGVILWHIGYDFWCQYQPIPDLKYLIFTHSKNVSKCVASENSIVKFVSRHGEYFRMVSFPMGLKLSYAVCVLICLCIGLTEILCGAMSLPSWMYSVRQLVWSRICCASKADRQQFLVSVAVMLILFFIVYGFHSFGVYLLYIILFL